MSRVLARNLFKKKAPKKSAKGVGITSMFEDDVAGYAEGGEVNDDRTERERIARQLLEQNRDENSDYQMFSEQERPRMYRPPATMGMVPPQPNPQQMQAMQMQQMAQMGMLPRFQEGGLVKGQVQPEVETPSAWSTIRDRLALPFRERTGPILDPNTGEPVEFYNPDDPLDRAGYVAAQLAASRLTGGIARLPTPGAGGMKGPGPWELDRTTGPWSKPMTLPRRATPPAPGPVGPTGPSIPQSTGPGTSVPKAGRPIGDVRFPPFAGTRAGSSQVDDTDFERKAALEERLSDLTRPPSEEKQAEMEMSREASRARGLSSLPYTPEKKKAPPPPPPPGAGGGKTSDLTDIKAEREARKAELAAQADAARKENMWLALMQAGLAIAGGRSSNAITNIGQGGQAGLASFMALEQQRRRDEDAAMRRDIAEREYGLQERKFLAQQPYLQAQTEYLRMRPEIAMAQLQARRDAQVRAAQFKAESDLEAFKQKNPYSEELYTNGKLDPIKEAMWLKKKQDRILAIDQAQQQGYGNNRMGLNIPGYTDEE